MSKLDALKQIHDKIDAITKLTEECIEHIYKAGYNEAIDDVVKYLYESGFKFDLSELKKE